MANRTVKDAKSIHGTNPQYLVEKIIRSRIYDSKYWKEECFALTAELLVDKAMELRYVGGVFGGNIKPTPFLCLTLKMLQIQPEKDIVVEFIKNEEFKYVRALGAFYMRLTGSSLDCYKYLEPLYNDNRKLRRQNRSAQFELIHMDEFIDELLREERVCDVILPRIQKRHILEENNEIEAKVSALEDDFDEEIEMEEDTKYQLDETPQPKEKEKKEKDRKRERSRSRDRGDRDRERERHGSRSRDRHKKDKERDRDRDNRERDRDREKDRRDRDKDRDRRDRDRDRDRRDKKRDDDRKRR
ncbi:pre-mRNA-splicing factor 38 [Aethina tumida]|uniref:pre-mRNA-splicing factor 38 n=1 Tax=Aethina tumida TaxID=116153 RepID=UPI00096B1364|nr:pre-mRNA-splicing factor 38 [Aethina tumida]